jgi:hypothetical protein
MNGNDKRKIAQTIVKQMVPTEVADVEYDASLGFEACARDIMKAIKEDNAVLLGRALKSLGDMIHEKSNYSKNVSINIGDK